MFRETLAIAQNSLVSTAIFDDPASLADFACSVTSAESKEMQEVLATMNVEQRLHATLILLKKELVNARTQVFFVFVFVFVLTDLPIQFDIGKDVEEKLSKRQREYFLMEQLKSIKKELGIEKDDKETVVSKYKEKIVNKKLTEQVSGPVPLGAAAAANALAV